MLVIFFDKQKVPTLKLKKVLMPEQVLGGRDDHGDDEVLMEMNQEGGSTIFDAPASQCLKVCKEIISDSKVRRQRRPEGE